jgi:hypothetical protein
MPCFRRCPYHETVKFSWLLEDMLKWLGGKPKPIDRATAATKPDRAATINIALSASVLF